MASTNLKRAGCENSDRTFDSLVTELDILTLVMLVHQENAYCASAEAHTNTHRIRESQNVTQAGVQERQPHSSDERHGIGDRDAHEA